jgi:hypothetical protein
MVGLSLKFPPKTIDASIEVAPQRRIVVVTKRVLEEFVSRHKSVFIL